MRSDDEDENDYEEDEDDDEDKDLFGDDQYDGDGDVDVDGDDGDGDGDEDEDEDDDDDGAGDDDDDDEDDDDEDEDDDDDDDGKDDDDEDAAEGSTAAVTDATPAPPKSKSVSPKQGDPPLYPAAQPPHLLRRALFIPGFTDPPASLSVEAVVGIPLPSAVHCLGSTACMSYLLAGSQDGYVRVYDLWASVNGGQVMTAQQRAVVGLGEGVNKAGVGRGWWAVDTPATALEVPNGTANGQAPTRKQEPVFSLACQGDGLWTLAGTQSGQINLYSLRHQPGHLIHSLTGHSSVVSALQLLPDETSLLSGSWDGTVREWDLNTGQTTRTYPTSGAQISAIGLRPTNVTVTVPEASLNLNIGPDFFKADREANGTAGGREGSVKEEEKRDADGDAKMEDVHGGADADADGEADDAASLGSLFDDDAEGEEEGDVPMADPTPTPAPTVPTPVPAPAPFLALPGASKPTPPTPSVPTPAKPAAKPFSAAPTIPRPAPSRGMPFLTPTEFQGLSPDVLLTAAMTGQVTLLDRRVGGAIGRLQPGDKAPPWCMSATWLGDGNQVLAGRRNGTIDVWDTRMASQHAPGLLRTLRTPVDSGPVSCVVAFPDGRHIVSASTDNIRLWNTADYYDPQKGEELSNRSRPPFRIVAGHHGGTISSMLVDPTCRFLVSASGDRGWQGEATKVVLVHEIKYS